jgi:hypothetical protein
LRLALLFKLHLQLHIHVIFDYAEALRRYSVQSIKRASVN